MSHFYQHITFNQTFLLEYYNSYSVFDKRRSLNYEHMPLMNPDGTSLISLLMFSKMKKTIVLRHNLLLEFGGKNAS
jgi:hypothetical protein